jgi:type III secretion system TyeA family effector delivery regulator
MEKILSFKEERLVQGQQILNMASAAGISDTEVKINFLREFKNLVSLIPLKSYDDVENRAKFLDAVQEALDTAIEAEEA